MWKEVAKLIADSENYADLSQLNDSNVPDKFPRILQDIDDNQKDDFKQLKHHIVSKIERIVRLKAYSATFHLVIDYRLKKMTIK